MGVLARLKNTLRFYRRHALFRITRDDTIPSLEPRIPVTFQAATLQNLPDVLSFRSSEIVSAFNRHIESGQIGVFVYHEGRAIGHGWMIANRGDSIKFANRYFRLLPREGLVHFCSVDENYRGKGIYQALLCELYRQAFDSGAVDVIYIDTEIANTSSRKAIQKTAAFQRNQYYVNLMSRLKELPWPWRSS